MTPQEEPGPTRAQRFGQFIAEAAREAGYEIDGQRSGGRKKLAQDTGMGQTAVGRMLAGQSIPDPRFFEPLANALGLELAELLIRSGLASPRAFSRRPRPAAPKLTVERAAQGLGIHSQRGRQLFATMVRGILEQEPEDESGAA